MNLIDIGKAHNQAFFSKNAKNSDSKSKRIARDNLSFLKTLESAQEPAFSEHHFSETELENLLDDIYQAGHELVNFPCLKNIQDYKKKISLFLKILIRDSVELIEVEGRLRKDMKRPKYCLIQTINEKLNKLGCFILQEQKDKLELLHKVNELYGLLVDLKH